MVKELEVEVTPWTISLEPDHSFINLTYQGLVTRDELKQSSNEIALWIESSGIRKILADLRLVKGGHGILDLYFLADQCCQSTAFPHTREAVLVPEEDGVARQLGRFWETACLNRGGMVRTFTNRDEAIAWLQ